MYRNIIIIAQMNYWRTLRILYLYLLLLFMYTEHTHHCCWNLLGYFAFRTQYIHIILVARPKNQSRYEDRQYSMHNIIIYGSWIFVVHASINCADGKYKYSMWMKLLWGNPFLSLTKQLIKIFQISLRILRGSEEKSIWNYITIDRI